jgi:hypothetical protein
MRPRLTGILASLVSAVVVSIVLFVFEPLPLSTIVTPAGASSYLFLSLVAGFLYGAVYRRAANDQKGGWIFGASGGFVLWMFNPLIWLPWLGYEPVLIGRVGMAVLLLHIVHGALMGVLYPWVHDLCARTYAR